MEENGIQIDHVGMGPEGDVVGVNDPGSLGFNIEKIYAVVAEDDNGEGIVAVMLGENQWLPLVFAKEEAIEKFKPIALSMAQIANRTTRVIEMSARRDVETLYEKS
jgi:hypothetical protein